jgi:hypothetical protein
MSFGGEFLPQKLPCPILARSSVPELLPDFQFLRQSSEIYKRFTSTTETKTVHSDQIQSAHLANQDVQGLEQLLRIRTPLVVRRAAMFLGIYE